MNDYEELRPLLLSARDQAVTDAVDRYDRALAAHLTAAAPQDRAAAARAARDAELRAAAIAGRPPVVDQRAIAAAQRADHAERIGRDALAGEHKAAGANLDHVVAHAATSLLHVLAAEYSATVGIGNPPPRHLATLWVAVLWPPLYDGPGEIVHDPNKSWPANAFAAVAWWPVPIPGAWPGRRDHERQAWHAHVLEQLARPRRKGYTMTDAGELRLSGRWQSPGRQPIRRGQGPGRLVAGDLVWVGGPDGVTPADIGGQTAATATLTPPRPIPQPADVDVDDDQDADDGADLAQLYADGLIDLTELNARTAARAQAAADAMLAERRAARR